MKKITVVLLLAILSITSIWSYTFENFEYDLDDAQTGIKITKYTGAEEIITVPSTIEDMPVTTIGERAFNSTNPKEVILPESIEIIEEKAFKSVRSLEKINFPSSLTKIDDAAFFGCSSLKNIPISINVEYGGNCFSDTGVEEVTIPENFGIIRKGKTLIQDPFNMINSWIHEVYEDESTSLRIFNGCRKLKVINLPKRAYIPSMMFRDCGIATDGIELYISKGVAVYRGAFGDANISKITIEEGHKQITIIDGFFKDVIPTGLGYYAISLAGLKEKQALLARGIDEKY